MKHMGMGMKGFGAKAAGAKGFFGFIGGFFKFLFFGIFFIIFAVFGLILFFAMRKKMQNQQPNTPANKGDIIDAEIIDTHPVKK
ncbi:MAG: hypothetical protein ABGX23_00450 [Nautiliaceae bacterium]